MMPSTPGSSFLKTFGTVILVVSWHWMRLVLVLWLSWKEGSSARPWWPGCMSPGTSLSELPCSALTLSCSVLWQGPCTSLVNHLSTSNSSEVPADPRGLELQCLFPLWQEAETSVTRSRNTDLNCLAGHNYPWIDQSTGGNPQESQHAFISYGNLCSVQGQSYMRHAKSQVQLLPLAQPDLPPWPVHGASCFCPLCSQDNKGR